PEGARQERALVELAVAGEQRAVPELAPDGLDGPSHALSRGLLAAEERERQHAGVHVVAPGEADVRVPLEVEAPPVEERAHAGRLEPPARASVREHAALGELAGALERDPAHRLRLRVVPLLVAALPDARVRLAPRLRDEV